ncbi:MAG: hypothetical protein E2P02_18215 [Acidobacteria bacterium]|nr:MAG: hypothetical protein E2P02_18215 [Acidobacteriota bacterium]
MKQHVSILGVLYIAFGVLGMVTAVAMLVLLGGAAGIVSMVSEQEPDAAVAVPILGILAVALFSIIAVLSLPGLVVGIGLVKLKSWARIGGLILSALNLLNFPFGTALGIYGLWVLLNKETEAAFT